MIPAPRVRAASRQMARREIVWCLVGLAVGQLAMATAIEGPWATIRDPEYGHKLSLLRRQTAGDPDRPLLLALGSSRTLNGLRPDHLTTVGPRVFNFGLTRHGPVQQLLAFDRLLRDGVRPRWVTVELLPLLLSMGASELDGIPAGRHTWGDVRYLQTHKFCSASHAVLWAEARTAPAYTNRFALMCGFWPAWVPWAERHDYVWNNADPAGWLANAEATGVQSHVGTADTEAMRHLTVSPESARALRLTLARCREERIGAAVILMPEAQWFRNLPTADAARQVRDLAAGIEHEFGVPIIDARDWCPDDEFRDGHHLLPTGAARFTERYGREVMPLFCDQNASAKRP